MYDKEDEKENKLNISQNVYYNIKKLSNIMLDLLQKNLNIETLNLLLVSLWLFILQDYKNELVDLKSKSITLDSAG